MRRHYFGGEVGGLTVFPDAACSRLPVAKAADGRWIEGTALVDEVRRGVMFPGGLPTSNDSEKWPR